MSDSRRFLLTLLSGVLLAAGLVAAVAMEEPESTVVDIPLLVATDSPTTTTTTPPVTAAAAAPAPPPPARKPVSVPRDAYAAEPVVEIGTIEIPKIGLQHRVMEGITMRNIDKGPSHWPGTALPGQVGNAVFAGHRVTKTRPFRHIDQLVPGDEVFFTINGPSGPIRTRYAVTGHEVVPPTALHIVDQTPTATATLFACHPPGSARYRYVVRLALAEPEG